MTDLIRSAELSPCGTFRYRLDRIVGPGRKALWIGVNPSTADAEIDDQSIRKLYGFGNVLGIGHWIVANKFAFRSTDVSMLSVILDPIGPDNDKHLMHAMAEADVVIAGWGNLSKLPAGLRQRYLDICLMADLLNITLWCWGTNEGGDPRHPLMLPYTTRLVPWQVG